MRYYTIQEVSILLGVSAQTLRNWDMSGKLKPMYKRPYGYCYTENDINALMNGTCRKGRTREKTEEIQTLVIPNGVTEIAREAYKYSTVKRVILPASVKKIGVEAFYSCKSLTEVVFPATLQEIGSDAFAYTGIQELKIQRVGKIGSGAFHGSKIKKATIWEWDQIDEETCNTFSGCEELTSLYLLSRMEEIPYKFCYGCKNLESIQIPYGVKRINFGAFEGCKKLTKAELPSTLQEIETYAFKGTALTRIDFPSGLQRINTNAFADCAGLAFPHMPALPQNCKVEQGAFMNMPDYNSKSEQPAGSLYCTIAGAVYRSMYKF